MFIVLRVACQNYFNRSCLRDMTNTIIEIPEVGVRLPERRVNTTLRMTVMYKCEETATHDTFAPTIG